MVKIECILLPFKLHQKLETVEYTFILKYELLIYASSTLVLDIYVSIDFFNLLYFLIIGAGGGLVNSGMKNEWVVGSWAGLGDFTKSELSAFGEMVFGIGIQD